MPAGLQIFDANGVLQGNYTSNYGRYLGTIWTGDYPGNSFTDARLASGRPWFQIEVHASGQAPTLNTVKSVGVSGSIISWVHFPVKAQVYIIYGVY